MQPQQVLTTNRCYPQYLIAQGVWKKKCLEQCDNNIYIQMHNTMSDFMY